MMLSDKDGGRGYKLIRLFKQMACRTGSVSVGAQVPRPQGKAGREYPHGKPWSRVGAYGLALRGLRPAGAPRIASLRALTPASVVLLQATPAPPVQRADTCYGLRGRTARRQPSSSSRRTSSRATSAGMAPPSCTPWSPATCSSCSRSSATSTSCPASRSYAAVSTDWANHTLVRHLPPHGSLKKDHEIHCSLPKFT